jgi:hypothetical protein
MDHGIKINHTETLGSEFLLDQIAEKQPKDSGHYMLAQRHLVTP